MNGSSVPQTAGSLDLDLLNEEFFPVDDFFNSYVNELSSRSKRPGDAGLLVPPEAKQMRLAGAGGAPIAATTATPFVMDVSMMGGAGSLNGLATGLMGASSNGHNVMQQALLQPGMLPGGALPAVGPSAGNSHGGMMSGVPGTTLFPGYPATAGTASIAVPTHSGSMLLTRGTTSSGLAPAAPVRSSGDGDSGGAYSDDMAGGADSKSSQRKSMKQQEANKVAQQRYRERKKAKFQEMEATIDQLTTQLAQLQALQSRNAILEGQNTDLESKLVEREREIERLKNVLDSQVDETLEAGATGTAAGDAQGLFQPAAVAAAEDGCCGPATVAAAAPDASGGYGGGTSDDTVACCDVLPKDLTGIDFKSGFSDQVAKLRAFAEEHNLRNINPSGETLSKPVLRELAQVVGRACQLCQAALRVEGIAVIDLITRDPATLSLTEDIAENQRWKRALEVMKLTPGQQHQLLMLRQAHLAKMRGIYEERQRLNLEAMALMLPHQSRNPYEDNTVEGRLQNISSSGYLAIARSNAELGAVLDRVKDNLRREQRAVMDINCVTISKIMTPVQSALYIIEVYPQHCDALALTNVLARTVGKEDLGIPPGRCPNAATCPKVAAGICDGYNCLTLGIEGNGCKGGNVGGGGTSYAGNSGAGGLSW